MRVFITGASGFIGSAVVPELIEAGHQVVGLARSDASAAALTAAGAEVHRGTLDDLDSLRAGAAASDGVIHLAFNHDFSQYEAAGLTDQRAVATLGAALEGTGRPLVVTSGTLALPWGRVGSERDPADPLKVTSATRFVSEQLALSLAARDVRSSVVRLPPSVHGEGKAGLVGTMIDVARARGVSGYTGDGSNRWPAVHHLDAAHLFCLALENAAAGTMLHGVADEGVPIRDIAEVIGRHLKVPVASISTAEASAHFGWLANALVADNPTSSALTRGLLGWQPTHPGLVDDLDQGHYFRAVSA